MSTAIINHLHGAMRAKAAAKFLGISVPTLWRWVKAGKLPSGIRLSARARVWEVEELQSYLNKARGEQCK